MASRLDPELRLIISPAGKVAAVDPGMEDIAGFLVGAQVVSPTDASELAQSLGGPIPAILDVRRASISFPDRPDLPGTRLLVSTLPEEIANTDKFEALKRHFDVQLLPTVPGLSREPRLRTVRS